MKTKQRLILVLMLSMLAQAACTTSAGTCPTATADTKLLMNAEDGYCLLYPADLSTALPHFIVINPVPGPGDVLGDAWASIDVGSADGRTAAQVADAEIAIAGSDLKIEKIEVTVDGEKAIMADGLPGQDNQRKVFIVRGDRLYTLSFAPWSTNAESAQQLKRLEHLYTTIMHSFHLLPPTKPLPTATLAWGPGNLPPPLTLVYPLDGQVLDFAGDYWFKVIHIEGAAYLWSFSQNGVVVWENLRDEMGLTAGGTYGILAGSDAHARFAPGPVEVSVRAQKGDYLADPTVITIILQAR